jgi:transaldolase
MNQLEQLKQYTSVVADTGDFAAIAQYQPLDATTNPSLLYKAAQMPEYRHLVEAAISSVKDRDLDAIIEQMTVNFGAEILKIIPGRVSTEVDAHLSFDKEGTIAAAERLIELYERKGVDSKRVLIKIAATYEGIQAAKVLESRGISTNMTLIFSLEQAILCAEAGAYLISPFVGRIYDWYKRQEQRDFGPHEDPGVISVKRIYEYYKTHKYSTIVMGASFRHIGQIQALTGCDYLTISPNLLSELQQETGALNRYLNPAECQKPDTLNLTEKAFRWHLNQNPMAHEKLAEGIRLFAEDLQKLKSYLIK